MSSASTLQQTDAREPAPMLVAETEPRAEIVFRLVCVALTLALPAAFCLGIAYVSEPDIWWHLTSGEWILAHHEFPRVDTFSSTTLGHPWQAYSWLFEVVLSKLYAWFGLAGIVLYTTTMVLAITAAFFQLIHASQKSLRIALPLTAVSALALLTLYSPRPWHITIFFFLVELTIIQQARRTGAARGLFLLPLMFVAWANIHIQFVDGLLLLALMLAESMLFRSQRSKDSSVSRVPPVTSLAVLAACLCATLINPYGWHIYSIAHHLASQTGVMNGIEELKAMPFRALSNYIVLFLTLAAAATLARKNRFQFFETALLLVAAFLSFRSQRDIWIVVAASAAILVRRFPSSDETASSPVHAKALALATVIAGVLLLGMARLAHFSDATLRPRLAAAMPVNAAAFVRDRHIQGPVFCDFIWGGYLMHSLALPVSVDGRAALHGDEQLDRSARTWAGAPAWSSNPQLNLAGVVIGPKSAPLTQLLRLDAHFDRVYEDNLAVIFIPHAHAGSPSHDIAIH